MTTTQVRRSRPSQGTLTRRPAASADEPGPEPPLEHSQELGRPPGHRSRRRTRLLARPGWPLTALLAAYPLWWVLGLAEFMFVLLAIPMLARLYAWAARGRRIRVPPGFMIWLLFLVVMLAGVATLSLTAPGTAVSPVSHRLLSFLLRSSDYLAVTVMLLFAGNLTERECSRRRLAWLLGLVGIYAAVGGIAGMVYPHLQFTSPLAYVLPHSFTQNTLTQSWMHPGLSQIQSVLGAPRGRPKAPFDYTNEWGNSIVLLLPWLLVWAQNRRQRRRVLAITVIAIAPVIYSLDRGTWLAVAFCICYLAVRFAARGKTGLLVGLSGGLALMGVLIVATPLHSVVTQRFTSTHHNSNDIRSTLDGLAVRDGLASPLIGYGDLRHMQGSPQSIAVGPTANCITCGQLEVGSTGQLWLLLVNNGFLGAALYLGFFAYGAWRFRRDTTPYGLSGVLVLLLTFVFMIAYGAVVAPLAFTMLAYALLWRNENHLRGAEPETAAGHLAHRPRVAWRDLGVEAAATGRVLPPTARPEVGVRQWSARPVRSTTPARPAADSRTADGGTADSRTADGGTADSRTADGGTADSRTADSRTADGGASVTLGTPGKKLTEVARGSTMNVVGAVISAATTLAVTVLVTRLFSKPVAGAFFSATSLFLIIESVTSLGAYAGAVYFIARLRLLGEEKRISIVIRAAVLPVLVASVTAASALLLFATPLARLLLGGHLGHSDASPGAVAAMLRALAFSLPFAALLDTLLGGTRGYRDMRPTVMVNQLGRSVLQLAGVGVAVAAGSVALLAPLWALPYLPAAAAAWLWLRHIRNSRPARPSARLVPPELAALFALASPVLPDGSRGQPGEASLDARLVAAANPRGFWRFTAPRALATMAQIIIQRLDIVLVGIIRGPAAAAVYTAATRFLVAGQLGNGAISMAAQPQFTELFATGDRRQANTIYQATTAWLVLLTWPMYLLVVVYGPQFLAIFGHSYQAGYAVVIILGITQLVAMACGQLDMVLITTGRSSWSLVNVVSAMSVNVVVDLLLIPHYGITGAAIGWAAAIGVFNALPLAQIAISVRLHPFGRSTLLASALCLASFGLVPLAVRAVAGTGPASIGVGVAASFAVAAVGLWRLRDPLQLRAMPRMTVLRRGPSTRNGQS